MRILLLGDHSSYHCGSDAVWQTIRRLLSRDATLVEPWQEHDAVVMNGEGTMHHGSTGFHAKMRRLNQAQITGRRSYLINTLWHENPLEYDPVLARLDGLMTRGEASRADLMLRHNEAANATLDLSYFEPIDESALSYDWTGRIVTTDFWVENFEFAWLSADFARDWLRVDLREISWSSLVKSLRTADLLVTGRHHAMYAAARARLPFVLLRGNSHKFLDLLSAIPTPIPVALKQAEILPMIKWAQDNRTVYNQLFDAIEKCPEPDLLAPRPTGGVPITKFYEAEALAKVADARRNYLEAGKHWIEAAQTGDNPATPLRQAALSYLRAGRIEDGMRALVEARAALPGKLNLVHFFPKCPQTISGGSAEKALLFTTRFWTAPTPHLHEKGGWGEAALSAAAAILLKDDDRFRAEAARMMAIAEARSPVDAVAARLALTFYLIHQTRNLLAEEFWDAHAPAGRPEWETVEDNFHVLTRTLPFSERTRGARDRLAAELAKPAMSKRTDLRFALLEHDWWTRAPDRSRAEDAVAHARAAPSDAAIFECALSSCIEATETGLAADLARNAKPPLLAAVAQKNAAIAAFLRETGLGPKDETIDDIAGFMARSRQVEQELIERLSDPQRSLAIVGNAPSELGRGSGAGIDGRDEVVRFNRFRIGGEWAADYGSRVTVVFSVLAAKDAFVYYGDLPPGTIICFMPCKRRFIERNWQRVAELEAAGFRICFPFMNVLGDLGRALGAWPTTGLMILHRLKAIRTSLRRSDLFGFAGGPDETGRYAYDSARQGNDMHDWAGERAALEAMMQD